jgi:hypothetical protein
MKPPPPIDIDDERFAMICRDEEDSTPYVDCQFDSLPPCDGDPDYSENPETLRRVAAWLEKAADWLEWRQSNR